MTTDFFKQIDAMQVQGDWIICIKQTKPERMTVSVVFKNDNCGDNARKIVPPLVFPDKSVAEINEKFFTDLNSLVPDTAKLFSSMEHYLKQREEAKKQSQIEKDKAEKNNKVKDQKSKKYEEAMKKVAELEKQEKYKEAWLKVPNPADFPDYAETLRTCKRELSKKFAPDLFGVPVTANPAEETMANNHSHKDPDNEEPPGEVEDNLEDDYEEQ